MTLDDSLILLYVNYVQAIIYCTILGGGKGGAKPTAPTPKSPTLKAMPNP